GTGIQTGYQSAGTEQSSGALSDAKQIDPSNNAGSVRVLSPGNDGNVTQSNAVSSKATSGNQATTTQTSNQAHGGSCGCGTGAIQVPGRRSKPGQGTPARSAAVRAFGTARSQCGGGGGAPGNDASPVRVWSPGNDGSVTQSNSDTSTATSGNKAGTTQKGWQG